jgi:hypothetical protein
MSTSEVRKLQEWAGVARGLGWTVEVTRGGSHLKWWNPLGRLVAVTPGTPGGGNRSIDNVRAKLRRAGLGGIR